MYNTYSTSDYIKKLKPSKLIPMIVGFVMAFAGTAVTIMLLSMDILPTYVIPIIPIVVALMIYAVSMVSRGYIKIYPNSIEIKNASLEPVIVNVQDVVSVGKSYKDVSTYAGATARVATEITICFVMRDGTEVKVNDSIYTNNDKDFLYNYLISKGFVKKDNGEYIRNGNTLLG